MERMRRDALDSSSGGGQGLGGHLPAKEATGPIGLVLPPVDIEVDLLEVEHAQEAFDGDLGADVIRHGGAA